jgi:presequence protease
VQDFYNLADVYLDAVFHPRCLEDEQIFQQEGWHHELDTADGDMAFKGVVFNEMKGVYSQPDAMHGRQVQACLFPDNNYAADSGGDPAVIPQLTYDAFKAFHGKFYHPSNARCAPCRRVRLKVVCNDACFRFSGSAQTKA